MSSSDVSWRLMWRRRGLGVDRCLPFFLQPSAELDVLREKIPAKVCVPDGGYMNLDGADKELIFSTCLRFVEYIAQHLPMVVTICDTRKHVPRSVSTLAVRAPDAPRGEKTFVGSFDALLRVFNSRPGTVWSQYHLQEIAMDMKVTSACQPLGLGGATMLGYFIHGHRVLKAAAKEKSRIGKCAVVAWLLHRPAGDDREGKYRSAMDGFVAFDMQKFVQWEPRRSKSPPTPLVLSGPLLVAGLGPLEMSRLPSAPRAVAQNRWLTLEKKASKGKISLQAFVIHFGMCGAQDAKKAAYRVGKRLRDRGFDTENDATGRCRRQPKLARVSDLRKCYYPQLV